VSANTSIEWADHSWSPWWGCQKVSPACTNCYAETLADRFRPAERLWRGNRARAKDWTKPWMWNRRAKNAGTTAKVFPSMCDPFDDHPEVEPWRQEFLGLCGGTVHLTWLLLTKRPENVLRMVPPAWLTDWPANVWVGTTVENQERADERIPHLLRVPAAVRFLSVEPMLSAVHLDPVWMETGNPPLYSKRTARERNGWAGGIGWVIAGGESGAKARPSRPEWFRAVRNACLASGVPFLFKQWGEWLPISQMPEEQSNALYRSNRKADEYESQDAIDESYGRACTVPHMVLRVDGDHCPTLDPRAFRADLPGWPAVQAFKVGKSAAGRLLDGVQHDGVPA